MITMNRTYSELILLKTLEERFEYLRLNGKVGEELFGYERYMNQVFYQSPEWRVVRRKVIIRDNGCDLGVDGWTIKGSIYVHHMNPITLDQLKNKDPILLDPENLISTSDRTHRAITLGDISLLPSMPVVRRPYDMCPWKKQQETTQCKIVSLWTFEKCVT